MLIGNHMQQYHLTDNELMFWLKYIEHQVGFVLPKIQNLWIKGIIERHMRQQRMDNLALLQAVTQDNTIYHQVFDDILIPRTQFFRHTPTFNFIGNYVKAWKLQQYRLLPNDTELVILPDFSVWSVGCSTGEEAVSIGLILANQLGIQGIFDVYGSDYHQKALAQANQGSYDISAWQNIPDIYRSWLDRDKTQLHIKPILQRHLHYFSHNLIHHQTQLPISTNQCQIIICQNVLMYFRQFEQRDIIHYLIDYLADDGILVLGVGEMSQLNHPQLYRLPKSDVNIFVKKNPAQWLEQLYS